MTLKDPKQKVKEMLEIYQLLNIGDFCREEADKHTRVAITALEDVSVSSPKKDHLKAFALDLLGRQT